MLAKNRFNTQAALSDLATFQQGEISYLSFLFNRQCVDLSKHSLALKKKLTLRNGRHYPEVVPEKRVKTNGQAWVRAPNFAPLGGSAGRICAKSEYPVWPLWLEISVLELKIL